MADAARVDWALIKAREQKSEATRALEAAAAALQPASAMSEPPLALEGVLKSLLQKGTLNDLIDNAQAFYQEYLDSGIPKDGFVDFDAWKTQHVASMIEREVSVSCRALRRTTVSSASTTPTAAMPTVPAELKGKDKGKDNSYDPYQASS